MNPLPSCHLVLEGEDARRFGGYNPTWKMYQCKDCKTVWSDD